MSECIWKERHVHPYTKSLPHIARGKGGDRSARERSGVGREKEIVPQEEGGTDGLRRAETTGARSAASASRRAVTHDAPYCGHRTRRCGLRLAQSTRVLRCPLCRHEPFAEPVSAAEDADADADLDALREYLAELASGDGATRVGGATCASIPISSSGGAA